MPVLTCPDPACGQSVSVPETILAGHRYGCPKCKAALPVAPADEYRPGTAPARRPWGSGPWSTWLTCQIALGVIAFDFLGRFYSAQSAVQQAAAGAVAGAWAVIAYASARCVEKLAR